jgi:cell division septum initiation protein DivIVA
MDRMSHGGDLFALGDGVASEPSFDVSFKGYDKRQVDRYVTQVESELATLAAERDQAIAQMQALAGQVQQLQVELSDLSRRAVPSRVSFRHLGGRVEQILTMAEEQAADLINTAQQEVNDQRAEAERLLADARERTALAVRDFDLALASRRKEEMRVDEQRRAQVAEEAQRLRAEAREVLSHAQQEAQAVRTAAANEVAGRRVQADRDIATAREEAERKAGAMITDAEQRLAFSKSEAERQLTEAQSEAQRQLTDAKTEAERLLTEANELTEKQKAEAGKILIMAQTETIRHLNAAQTTAEHSIGAAKEEAQRILDAAKERHAEIAQLEQRLVELRGQVAVEVERLGKAQKEAEEAERRKIEATARPMEPARPAEAITPAETVQVEAEDPSVGAEPGR